MQLSQHRDDRENIEIATAAGDMAWGHIKEWHLARDLEIETSAEKCRELALDICVEWHGRKFNSDPTEDICRETLRRLGFAVAHGELGFDAVLRKIEKRVYTVRFGWWMPVLAEYDVEMPEDATPEQIVEAAHKLGDEDCWSAQEDIPDGMTATFVDDILLRDERHKSISIPENWREDRIVCNHFFREEVSALRAAEKALAEAHQSCGGGDDNIFAEPLRKVRAVLAKIPAKKFEVINCQSGLSLGVYEAESEQEARDACARDAGYKSEAEMVERLGQPSQLKAVEVA